MILRVFKSFLVMILLLCSATLPAETREEYATEQLRERSELFVLQLLEARLFEARAQMTPTLRAQLTEEALRQMMGNLTTSYGKVERVGTPTVNVLETGIVDSAVPVEFAKAKLLFQISFERLGPLAKIRRFSMQPMNEESIKRLVQLRDDDPGPSYARNELFRESEHRLEINELSLSAVLTMPTIAGESARVPGVVLIGGSGYSNEQGERKAFDLRRAIFRDLAHGLATQGIAVLRYAQRGHEYPELLDESSSYGVNDVLIQDAKAAVRALRQLPEIDHNRITIIGHNFGAYVAPVVAEQAKARQAVLIEPIPMKVDEYVRQTILRSSNFEDNAALHNEAKTTGTLNFDRLIALGALRPYSASFWKDLAALNPEVSLKSWNGPFMVLFSSEYQHTPTELVHTGWDSVLDRELFRGEKRIYESISQYTTQPEEQASQTRPRSYVREKVINDIAAFVRSGR